jgi:hypothetical protein
MIEVVKIVGVSGRHILCSVAIELLQLSDESRELVVRAISERAGHPVCNGVKIFGTARKGIIETWHKSKNIRDQQYRNACSETDENRPLYAFRSNEPVGI